MPLTSKRMTKLWSKRGKCGKGKPNPKAGLTPTEAKQVEVSSAAIKARWEYLLSLNQWKPIK